MICRAEGNLWNMTLCQQFPPIIPVLQQCPQGGRILRTGQYWASSNYGGLEGRIIEIMGVYGNNINGRSWLPAILGDGWPSPTGHGKRLSWVTPMLTSDSRGAGATEQFNMDDFFGGQVTILQLSEEVPKIRIDEGEEI